MNLPRVLTIAGSDSGGGAGIQADLKTFQAFDVYGMSAITSITAQNTKEVKKVEDVPIEMVGAQIEAVVEDIGIDAVKIGMLSHKGIIKKVAEEIRKFELSPVVLDPVMVSKSGHFLLAEGDEVSLMEELMPEVTLLTPNIPEAELISKVKIKGLEDMKNAARRIYEASGCQVLVKGGHLEGDEIIDLLYENEEFIIFRSARIDSKNTHGTGCTFSSGIAASLAGGDNLQEAVTKARNYVADAIKAAPQNIGSGYGPMYHNV